MKPVSRPLVRPSDRDFVLAFIRRDGIRPDATPNLIVGFTASVHFGRGFKASYALSACSSGWRPVDCLYFENWSTLLLVAEVFYRILPSSWTGCHPARGDSLYGKPRSKVERLHRSLVLRVDLARKRAGSMADYYRLRAEWAGAESAGT